jgi:hypothetical protein
MRAESGNAISNENPNFDVGSAGGDGWTSLAWPDSALSAPAHCSFVRDDFVSVPIASLVIVGGSQARRAPTVVLPDFIGCIICLRNTQVDQLSMGSASARQGNAGNRRRFTSDRTVHLPHSVFAQRRLAAQSASAWQAAGLHVRL